MRKKCVGAPLACPPSLWRVGARWAQKIVRQVLRMEKASHWKIGVRVTDNREIRRIHKKFLNQNTATDVMAFHLGPRQGDIVVSAEMAKKMAKKLGIGFREEFARYLVHGTLHLLGYRDKTIRDRTKMWKRQEDVIARLRSSRSNLAFKNGIASSSLWDSSQ